MRAINHPNYIIILDAKILFPGSTRIQDFQTNLFNNIHESTFRMFFRRKQSFDASYIRVVENYCTGGWK